MPSRSGRSTPGSDDGWEDAPTKKESAPAPHNTHFPVRAEDISVDMSFAPLSFGRDDAAVVQPAPAKGINEVLCHMHILKSTPYSNFIVNLPMH